MSSSPRPEYREVGANKKEAPDLTRSGAHDGEITVSWFAGFDTQVLASRFLLAGCPAQVAVLAVRPEGPNRVRPLASCPVSMTSSPVWREGCQNEKGTPDACCRARL